MNQCSVISGQQSTAKTFLTDFSSLIPVCINWFMSESGIAPVDVSSFIMDSWRKILLSMALVMPSEIVRYVSWAVATSFDVWVIDEIKSS
jgi:hypothetical protein